MNRSSSPSSPLHKSTVHESGLLHTSGQATYVDDLPPPFGTLVGWILPSPIARGRITRLNLQEARKVRGVAQILTAQDIQGINDIAPFTHDEPLLAQNELYTVGQAIALVVGESAAICRQAIKAIELEVEEDQPILSIRQAIQNNSYHGTPHIIQRGNVEEMLERADLVLEGEVDSGGQDHFYLETHCALVIPQENQTYHVHSSTQHPSEVQAKVAEVLGLDRHKVVVETRRMGGGFGGKETQGAHFAALAALASSKTKRPVKIWLNRDQDMTQTGKRHPFYSTYKAGFDQHGRLLALKAECTSNGGWSADLSGAILDRGLFHLDNAYYIPHLRFEGRVAKTNLLSNTAFRGFGGPQGVVVIEEILNRVAEHLHQDPAQIRALNFYGPAPKNKTPYDQEVIQDRSLRIFEELTQSARYTQRRAEIDTWNAHHPWVKRGIGYQPVKFGISFTNSVLNQAGALVLIYSDGSVQLNHGGTEMGQGLHTKMLAICAHTLGVQVDRIRMMNTATDKVPNTSATAASSGSDLNGQAVAQACETLKTRLRPVAADLLKCPPSESQRLEFVDGVVIDPLQASQIPFDDVVNEAYLRQISLSSTGFYRTPNIHYNRDEGRGKPFHYYAYGGAILEVEVNGLTGEYRLTHADILHDAGKSLIPSIDIGQVEGGFIQGLGWLTREELFVSQKGEFKTHSPDTYKIPALGDAPLHFKVDLLSKADQDNVIHGSKAVGEPPFLLAIGILSALRHAIGSFHPNHQVEALPIPCTPEAVLASIEVARGYLSADQALQRYRG